jgi:hypothetical protein
MSPILKLRLIIHVLLINYHIYIYISIPSNVQNAMEDPKWTRAMNEEMKALQKNNT